MRRLLFIALVGVFTLLGTVASAQGHFGGGLRTGGGFRSGGGFPRGRGVSARPFGLRHHHFNRGLFSFPYYDDFLDSEYVDGSPQVIVIREDAKTSAAPVAPAVIPQPKMIEVPGSTNTGASAVVASPVVIVLRDGEKREMTRYTITGAYLYDSSKALQTSRIPIDDLDLEATVHANAERGVSFSIPAQRNEVVVRF